MKINLRFLTRATQATQHTHVAIFIDGAHCGFLIMSPAQAIWFHHVLAKGAEQLSPKGSQPIEFVSSGTPPDPEPSAMSKVVNG